MWVGGLALYPPLRQRVTRWLMISGIFFTARNEELKMVFFTFNEAVLQRHFSMRLGFVGNREGLERFRSIVPGAMSALQKVLSSSKDVFHSEQRSDRVRQDVVPDGVQNQRDTMC
jgi:hypothetical protein